MLITGEVLIGVLLGACVFGRVDIVVRSWQGPRIGARARLRLEADFRQLSEGF